MDEIKLGSNRSFGIVFFIVFLIISLWPLLNSNEIRIWSLIVSIIFLILGLINSKALTPLNKVWFKFGIFLGNIISPIVMGIIYFVVVTPIAILLKVFKKDVFDKINLVEDDFAFCPEVTSKVSNLKEKIIEIPINYRGRDYKEGKKIRIKDGFLALRAIFLYGFLYKFKKN